LKLPLISSILIDYAGYCENYLVNLFAWKKTLITFAPAFIAKFIQDLGKGFNGMVRIDS